MVNWRDHYTDKEIYKMLKLTKKKCIYYNIQLDKLFIDYDGTINYYGNIILRNEVFKSFPFKGIKNVYGDLIITNCRLTTLYRCPSFVEGNFDISDNILTSLKHGPKRVNGNYIASNNLIVDAKQVAKYIDGHLDLSLNESLDVNTIRNKNVELII